ncbi:MAG: glycosyl hydrolase [Verrucomicrobiota bacterium]
MTLAAILPCLLAAAAMTVSAQAMAPFHAVPADPQASPAARKLLSDLSADCGRRTWSGQHGTGELDRIAADSGRSPLVIEQDFMDYSRSRIAFGAGGKRITEDMIALGKAGHVLAFSWHWNAPTNLPNTPKQPWWSGFYTRATTFDLAAALADTNSLQYQLMLGDIDAVAVELKKVATNGLPVLWRPLHEAEGRWFWWGARGPEPFKQLWRLMFHRLTVDHGLHNLVWVFTGEKEDWYPGDDVVDVVGVDAYPKDRSDLLLNRWEPLAKRFAGRKLIALTEFGSMPQIDRMQSNGVWWAWFSPWPGMLRHASNNLIERVYRSPGVLSLPASPAPPPAAAAPALQLWWPQEGTEICSHEFTADGQLDATNITVSAEIRSDQSTNSLDAVVDRNGHFWLESVPVTGKTNTLTVTARNKAGQSSTLQIQVLKSDTVISIDPFSPDELWKPRARLTGGVFPGRRQVWINGIPAEVDRDGRWIAEEVPVPATNHGGKGMFHTSTRP